MTSTLTPLRIALDWTPNTLHAPLLLAASLKFYEQAGLNVTFTLPSSSTTTTTDDTPARRLQKAEADLALCPSETVISYTTSAHPLHLQAITALLRKDASRLAAIPALTSPAELAGFRYGSYNARFEDAIVRAVVRNAANARTTLGPPEEEEEMDVLFMHDIEKLSMFAALMKGEIEATWVFEPWEGVRARLMQFPCRLWEVGKFGVRYGYSPVIVRNLDRSPGDDILRSFLAATKRAVKFLLQEGNERKCVEVLKSWCPDEEDTEEFLEESLKSVRAYAFDGRMEEGVWENFVNWLRDEKLVEKVDWRALFTNEFHG